MISKCSCRYVIISVIVILTILSACGNEEHPKRVSLTKRGSQSPEGQVLQRPGTLNFGFDLRLNPKEDVRIYNPFLKYLERNTGNRFSIVFSKKYRETIENLGNGITHFAALGPVSCIIAKKKYGAGCLVMGVNEEGKAEYRAVIFTRLDSPIKSITDLKGRRFAFGNRYSTQGHVIPRKMLEDAGISLDDLGGYAYTGSHVETVRAVLSGEYDAGGMQDTLAKRLVSEGKIKIIAVSKSYPSSLICYNKNVDPRIVKSVKIALLAFDPKGKDLGFLVDWDRTEMPNGFTEVHDERLNEIMNLTIRYGLLK